jgi:hypothetical protein
MEKALEKSPKQPRSPSPRSPLSSPRGYAGKPRSPPSSPRSPPNSPKNLKTPGIPIIQQGQTILKNSSVLRDDGSLGSGMKTLESDLTTSGSFADSNSKLSINKFPTGRRGTSKNRSFEGDEAYLKSLLDENGLLLIGDLRE